MSMMQSSGGLLGAFSGEEQAAPAPASGGLLGAAAGAQGGQGGLQMALRLSQSPTPETAQQIIQQLHQMQNPEAAQFEQMISQVMDNPQALKQLADSVVQKLGGGNA